MNAPDRTTSAIAHTNRALTDPLLMLLPRVAGRDFPPLDLVEVIVVEITHTHKHLTMFKDSSPKLACPKEWQQL